MMQLNNLIIPYGSSRGNWDEFIECLYEVFVRDFILSMPMFRGHEVDFYDKRKIDSNKEESFWHLTSRDYPIKVGSALQKERKPDIKRAERIAWVREIIENHNDDKVTLWTDKSFTKAARHHLWYNQEFLVVIEDLNKFNNYNLITAFCTDKRWEIEKFTNESRKWRT